MAPPPVGLRKVLNPLTRLKGNQEGTSGTENSMGLVKENLKPLTITMNR